MEDSADSILAVEEAVHSIPVAEAVDSIPADVELEQELDTEDLASQLVPNLIHSINKAQFLLKYL